MADAYIEANDDDFVVSVKAGGGPRKANELCYHCVSGPPHNDSCKLSHDVGFDVTVKMAIDESRPNEQFLFSIALCHCCLAHHLAIWPDSIVEYHKIKWPDDVGVNDNGVGANGDAG